MKKGVSQMPIFMGILAGIGVYIVEKVRENW